MNHPMRVLFFFSFAAFLVPALAHAHAGPHAHEHFGFAAGFAHPFGGLDHLLAMLAVGLWAGQLGGRARWLAPLSFAGVMGAGGALGVAGAALPYVEAGILASVLVLGLLVAFAAKAPLHICLPLVAAFALFHGNAHGLEMAGGSALAYGAGFVLATALLHAAGLGLGAALERKAGARSVRLAGGAVAVAAVMLAVL